MFVENISKGYFFKHLALIITGTYTLSKNQLMYEKNRPQTFYHQIVISRSDNVFMFIR